MNGTIPCGRWAGVQIGLHWSVLVMIAIITQAMALATLPTTAPGYPSADYWMAGAAVALLFLGSLLAHELAHAITARHHGVRAERLTLWLLGGQTELSDEAPTARTELLITVAGPLASLTAAALFAVATMAGTWFALPPLVLAGLGWLAIVNLILAAFNLLPGAPLDGGRILHAVLWKRTGDRERATRTATRSGRVVGMVVLGIGLAELLVGGLLGGVWLALVGWFLIAAATSEESNSVLRHELADITIRDVMTPEPTTAPSWLTVDAFLDTIGQHARRRVFPVVDFTGHPCGVVSLGRLTRLSPDARATMRVADACRPLADVMVVAPGDRLTDVMGSGRIRWLGLDLILVIEGGHLLGVMNGTDLARTVELAMLRPRTHAYH